MAHLCTSTALPKHQHIEIHSNNVTITQADRETLSDSPRGRDTEVTDDSVQLHRSRLKKRASSLNMWQFLLFAALALADDDPNITKTPEPTPLPTDLYWGLVFGCTAGGALLMAILGAIAVAIMNREQHNDEYETMASFEN